MWKDNDMKVLFVIGACLKVNTSANLCHIAYINGCIENGCEVDVVSMSERGCAVDNSIVLPSVSHWYTFDPPLHNNASTTTADSIKNAKNGMMVRLKKIVKQGILRFYGIYGRTASVWVNRAKHFKTDIQYDYVISLATPYVSHHLANLLIRRGNVKCNKWIQVWEDPWAADLYNIKKDNKKKREEERLLSYSDQVVYVSPLTLEYQKKMYPKYADKMTWYTLPYYYKNEETKLSNSEELLFGYYGDYFSFSRDLTPFYSAAIEEGIKVNIYGNSDINISECEKITVKPRVGLDELSVAEKQTDVLVFLCNLKGGQIPGKLYQYSATGKIILFILDGDDHEITVLKEYFSKFNRYIFCYNNVESIKKAIQTIISKNYGGVKNNCVEQFSPQNIVYQILHS